MAFDFKNLDQRTSELMLEEMQYDVDRGALYLSDRLNTIGKEAYPGLLKDAIIKRNEETLADAISGLLNPTYKTKASKTGEAKMPSNAHTMLAEGEFNRFYMRALCKKALEQNMVEVTVYRAKEVSNPRPESTALIGTKLNPRTLLDDLRTHIATDTALGLPPGPNSGLSIMF